jgi:hypothetical protein
LFCWLIALKPAYLTFFPPKYDKNKMLYRLKNALPLRSTGRYRASISPFCSTAGIAIAKFG